jgi:hypothetical protein
MFYNKVLSLEEITQNFNALKNRYGIWVRRIVLKSLKFGAK